MTEPAFTKGPWVYKWFGGPQIGGGRGGVTAICTLRGSWRSEKPTRQERANRDLICAAPDLYEALAEADDVLRGMADDEIEEELLPKLAAALAKARGKA